MALSLDDLPNDVEKLKAMILAISAETEAALAENAKLTAEHLRLDNERMVLSAEVERTRQQNERLELIINVYAALTSAVNPSALTLNRAGGRRDLVRRRRRDRREEERDRPARWHGSSACQQGHLPLHLPREEVVIEPEATACPCCGGALHVIGEDISERLDKIPTRLRVIVTRRPKYACRACTDGVVQASAPNRLIPGGLPTEALVADVLEAKYANHLPLYRQAQMFAREGVQLNRSTLAHLGGLRGRRT